MSYQEIYGGLNKKASNEQIKKLASVLKGRHMVKKASAEQVKQLAHALGMKKRGGLKDVVKGLIPKIPVGDFGRKVLYTTGKAVYHNPIKTTLFGAAAAGTPFVLGSMYGSAGKSDLQDALSRTQAQNTQLTKKLDESKNESVWAHILRVLGKYLGAGWKAFKGAFSAEDNTPKTDTVKK